MLVFINEYEKEKLSYDKKILFGSFYRIVMSS